MISRRLIKDRSSQDLYLPGCVSAPGLYFSPNSDNMSLHRPSGRFLDKNIMQNFINYLRDTRGELKHVAWPTQRQAIIYSALVVGVSILVAIVIGAFDFVFNAGLDWFIK